jgi:hypothetical protein
VVVFVALELIPFPAIEEDEDVVKVFPDVTLMVASDV